MTDAALTFLIDNVSHLLKSHHSLISNAEDELNQLIDKLHLMQGFLESASRKMKKQELFKTWERQVRQVVYEVEDIIDAATTGKNSNKIMAYFNLKTTSLAKEVKNVMTRKVTPVLGVLDFGNMQLNESTSMGKEDDTVDTRSKVPSEKHVVGFHDVINTLTSYINKETKFIDVISIVGMPGNGKTTVASKIYNDPNISFSFPTRIWVCISSDFDKKELLVTILKKLTDQDLSGKTDAELSEMICRLLEDKKFLLVLDDMWTIEAWREIQQVLPKKNTNGKILITTRSTDVAKKTNQGRDPYMLRFLDTDESLELLQYEVFGVLGNFPKKLEKFGKVIAKQCDGLPLAIIVIGGILLEKTSITGEGIVVERAWESISESVKSYMIYGDREEKLKKYIALSYAKLPYHLRNCFLYMGMFAEDTKVPAWNLIQLWIAEGFIKEQRGRSLEEVAQENLKELINRNLVMPGKITANGDIKTCSIHDTIREFCQYEAGRENEDLFREIRKSRKGPFEPAIETISTVRRVSIHSNVDVFLSKKPKVLRARSLLCYSKEPINLQIGDTSSITKLFNLLRVLDAKPINFHRFPPNIAQLIHLRYLNISGDQFTRLPEDISNLWNLQTLIVNTLSRTLEIKADIWKMVQLKHLKTKASITLKDGVGKGGENLQTLSMLSPQSCTDDFLQRAENLNTLGIHGDISQLQLNSINLSKLDHLDKLKLMHDVYPKVASRNPLQEFPQSSSFPQKIKYLTLSGTHLDWKHMSYVGKLRLKVLKLKENAFVGDCWDAEPGSFHDLVFLHIGLTDLKTWKVMGESLFNLISLVLKNCSNLEAVPSELGDSDNFESLYIESVKKSVAVSARGIEERQKARGSTFKVVIAPGVEGSHPTPKCNPMHVAKTSA